MKRPDTKTLAVILAAIVLLGVTAACTTAPPDVDVPEEKSCTACQCPAGFHRRSGGMFDLARETKRKVDEAMQDREAWRTGDIPDKEGRCAGKTADTF